jgi:ankyrin repeat protein
MSILCKKSKQEKNVALQALIPGSNELDKKDINGWTGLITVAFDGATVKVKTLLDRGNNVTGKTRVDYTTSATGDVESQRNIAETLLGNNNGVKGKDINDKEALIIAALLNGHTEIVRLLKHYGAKE